MLAVVVSDVEVDGEFDFERRMLGSDPEQLRALAAWLLEQEVEEVVVESTAQYWKPVWGALGQHWKPIREKQQGARRKAGKLHLAQAESNRGAVAIPRAADRPTGARASHSAPSLPGRCSATSGSAGSGSGLSPTDHCRSRPHRSDISVGA